MSVWSSPNGLPIAYVVSPTCSLLESANVSGVNVAPASCWTRSTARSVDSSRPTTDAGWVAPSPTLTETAVAPSTTWAFVTIKPALEMTKPVPVASPWSVCDLT